MALLAVYHCKSSISVGWSLLTVFLGELLGILNKLLLVFRKLLCNVTWDQRDNNVVFLPARSALRGCSGSGSLTRETKDCITCSVLVAGFQFSAAMIGRHTCRGEGRSEAGGQFCPISLPVLSRRCWGGRSSFWRRLRVAWRDTLGGIRCLSEMHPIKNQCYIYYPQKSVRFSSHDFGKLLKKVRFNFPL